MGKKRKRTGRKKVFKSIKEFRKERTKEGEGHPRFFFKRKGRRLWGFGITHGERKDGKNTLPLKHNPEPNPKDKRPSRISTDVEVVPENVLSERLPWAFSEEDKPIIEDLIKRFEETEKEKKDK